MIALGLSPLDKDSNVTLAENGRVLFAAGEERFTRNKLQDGFPAKALQAGLDYCKLTLKDIDVVAYPFFDAQKEAQLFTKNIQDESDFLDDMPFKGMRSQIKKALTRVPARTHAIPGLLQPNETMEKSSLHKLFYRMAGAEGVVSRNLAKRSSRQWKKESLTYHQRWQDELEGDLKDLGLLGKLKRYDHH